jgi:hypothetical protein
MPWITFIKSFSVVSSRTSISEDISFSAKILGAVGENWTADIFEEVEGQSTCLETDAREEDADVMPSVVVGSRTERSSSVFRIEGRKSKDEICIDGTECCGTYCRSDSEPHGTARSFKCILSALL